MNQTPLSSILMVLASTVIGSFGAVFLKLGAGPLKNGLRHILNWKLVAGLVLFVGSSVPFVMALRHGELSVLYPMASLTNVWTLGWSKLFFNESITRGKVGALAMILLGLVCIGVGGR